MSDVRKDGGPAFPAIKIEQIGDPAYYRPTHVHCPGMSLRDWFAGQYQPTPEQIAYADRHGPGMATGIIAELKFQHANEMLNYRENIVARNTLTELERENASLRAELFRLREAASKDKAVLKGPLT